jgi:hypothetical protein
VNGPDNGIYNNVIYDVENIGIMINNNPVAGDVQSVIKNNIVYAASVNHIVYISNDVGLSPTFDYNCYWMGTGGETKYYWKVGDYTFTNWKTQSGGDANSVEDNPDLVSPSTVTPDFTLQSSSPCINAGVDVGLTEDYAGAVVPTGSATDIGAYEYPVVEVVILDPILLSPNGTVIVVVIKFPYKR